MTTQKPHIIRELELAKIDIAFLKLENRRLKRLLKNMGVKIPKSRN